MRRTTDRDELLDGALDDAQAVRGNLRDLARVNRWLGGTRLSAAAIDALLQSAQGDGRRSAASGPFRLIDVGTGAADIPASLVQRFADRPRSLDVTGIDNRSEIVVAARSVDRRLAALERSGRLVLVVGDGRSLPYPDAAFDVAHCSLVLHHLPPAEAVALLVEMRRIARLGVVVNDLVRSRTAWLGAWALTRIATRNRYTRHDAPLSVRRAYTRRELTAIIEAAGLRPIWTGAGLLGHRVAIATRPPGLAA